MRSWICILNVRLENVKTSQLKRWLQDNKRGWMGVVLKETNPFLQAYPQK